MGNNGVCPRQHQLTLLRVVVSYVEVAMKTILVPLDGSAQADTVLPYVAYLVRTQAARTPTWHSDTWSRTPR